MFQRVAAWQALWTSVRETVKRADEAEWCAAREVAQLSYRHVVAAAAMRRLLPRTTETAFGRLEGALATEQGAVVLLLFSLPDASSGPAEETVTEVLHLEALLAFARALPAAWRSDVDERRPGWEPNEEQAEWIRRWAEENPEMAARLDRADEAG